MSFSRRKETIYEKRMASEDRTPSLMTDGMAEHVGSHASRWWEFEQVLSNLGNKDPAENPVGGEHFERLRNGMKQLRRREGKY